jgi:hypothetical protein
VGIACTGVAHCGQTVASSGMEAPHLKQNIQTSFGFRPFFFSCSGSTIEKYFIQIEKAIISRLRGTTLVRTSRSDRRLSKAFECRLGGKVSAHAMHACGGWSG